MIEETEIHRIPYTEYKAIGTLAHAHFDAHKENLRTIVAFGALVTAGNTYDIDLLEVVDGWRGASLVEFTSTAELPLRGRLRLYLLSSEDFETPYEIIDTEQKQWVIDLIKQVYEGYDVIMQSPPSYATHILEQKLPPAPPLTNISVRGGNPLQLLEFGSLGEDIPLDMELTGKIEEFVMQFPEKMRGEVRTRFTRLAKGYLKTPTYHTSQNRTVGAVGQR